MEDGNVKQTRLREAAQKEIMADAICPKIPSLAYSLGMTK
jgi:hypothetical protein